jgi:threonyl-tRNA synthetase
MIHRAILGSVERFIGSLIEHYAGAFPAWLAPVQVAIIPIKDEQREYAEKIKGELQQQGRRVIIDARNESLNKRIREATLQKVPYLLVVGDRERASGQVSVRQRAEGDLGDMPAGDFFARLQEDIDNKQ